MGEGGSQHQDERTLASVGRLMARVVDAGSGVASAERARFLEEMGRRGSAPRWRLLGLVGAVAVAAALALAVLWPRPLAYVVRGASSNGAFIHAAEGAPGGSVAFSDGSSLELSTGTRLRVSSTDARGARIVLEHGRIGAHVVSRPGARWAIEAGPYQIDVTGTAFDVEWTGPAAALRVQMHEGQVWVHGPATGGAVSLVGTERLELSASAGTVSITAASAHAATASSAVVPAPASAASLAAPLPAPPSEQPAPAAPPASAPTGVEREAADGPAPAASRVSWSQRVAAGDYRSVLGEADEQGIDQALAQRPLADLVALADASRYAGRTGVARRALLAQRARFAGSGPAVSAAFLLGRMADDADHAPAAAIGWYDRYLSEAPGGAFAAEALGRKMLSSQRLGAATTAQVARDYLRRFPRGPHAPRARVLAGEE
jgi:hypothetical protein